MPRHARGADEVWRDAILAAKLLAVDPSGLGGVNLRARVGPLRDQWLGRLKAGFPDDAPIRRAPPGTDAESLLGGYDLTALLRDGERATRRGLLASVDGGLLIVPMAERVDMGMAGLIAGAMDRGSIEAAQSGGVINNAARFACVLLDEGVDDNEAPPSILLNRVAFLIDLDNARTADEAGDTIHYEDIEDARRRFPDIAISDDRLGALDRACLSVGVASVNALLMAARAARASAALHGRAEAARVDLEIACRLVIGPRAAPMLPEEPPTDDGDSRETGDRDAMEDDRAAEIDDLDELLIAAAKRGVLAFDFAGTPARAVRAPNGAGGGKSGAPIRNLRRGRVIGAQKSLPRGGARLHLLATLRAAAPRQRLRPATDRSMRLRILAEDLHVQRRETRTETSVIFVVDASGSSAMQRLGEVKGAVELLLADCYRRRDQVSLIAFRGICAETLLAPTRSLVRAKRALAALPGGGGTPLAAGLLAAAQLAHQERRQARTPFIVILSDGRGNIDLQGEPGREGALEDTRRAARLLRDSASSVMVFDTAPRPSEKSRELSEVAGAVYCFLPYADSASVASSVRSAIDRS